MMSFATSTLIVALLTLPLLVTSRNCYSRNGTLITDIAYQPCNSSPSADSACCGLNHSGAGHVGIADDVCGTNGLCQNYEAFDGTNQGVKMWWRQGCTDATWQSANCLASVCDMAEYEYENAPVYSCGNGKWCCGKKSCCNASTGLFTLAATLGAAVSTSEVSVSTSTSASISTSLPETTRSESATTADPSTSSVTVAMTDASKIILNIVTPTGTVNSEPPLSTAVDSSLLSTAAKAGIGAGVAVLALLLGIILFLLHKVKKHKKQQLPWDKAELSGQSQQSRGKPEMVVYAREIEATPVELPAHAATAVEMNAQQDKAELAAREQVQEIGQGTEKVELDASTSINERDKRV
jgi:hypothetical protein